LPDYPSHLKPDLYAFQLRVCSTLQQKGDHLVLSVLSGKVQC